MALGSCTRQSLCNNPPANITREQDELASPQELAERLDAGSNKTPTPSETPTLLLVLPTEDLFLKFMKAFVELTQTQN